MLLKTCVPISNVCDHYPACVTWSKKGTKIPKIGHNKIIRYRCSTTFNEQLLLQDLSSSPLDMVYNKTDPEDPLNFWIDTFVTIYDKHAPYKRKRMKSCPKPKWFSKELQEAFYFRDFLQRYGQHEHVMVNMKSQRN